MGGVGQYSAQDVQQHEPRAIAIRREKALKAAPDVGCIREKMGRGVVRDISFSDDGDFFRRPHARP
jgi:hypothetical protein